MARKPKTTKNIDPNPHPRDAKGRFLPKSALGEFTDRINTNKQKGNFPTSSNNIQRKLLKLNGIIDPENILSSLRKQNEMLSRFVDASVDNMYQQKNKTNETAVERGIVQQKQNQLVNIGLKSQELLTMINDGLYELEPSEKETVKYIRLSSAILEQIYDRLGETNNLFKIIPFKLDQLKDISNSCCRCDKNGNEHNGGGLGLGLLEGGLGGFATWKIMQRLRKTNTLSSQKSSDGDEPFNLENENYENLPRSRTTGLPGPTEEPNLPNIENPTIYLPDESNRIPNPLNNIKQKVPVTSQKSSTASAAEHNSSTPKSSSGNVELDETKIPQVNNPKGLSPTNESKSLVTIGEDVLKGIVKSVGKKAVVAVGEKALPALAGGPLGLIITALGMIAKPGSIASANSEAALIKQGNIAHEQMNSETILPTLEGPNKKNFDLTTNENGNKVKYSKDGDTYTKNGKKITKEEFDRIYEQEQKIYHATLKSAHINENVKSKLNTVLSDIKTNHSSNSISPNTTPSSSPNSSSYTVEKYNMDNNNFGSTKNKGNVPDTWNIARGGYTGRGSTYSQESSYSPPGTPITGKNFQEKSPKIMKNLMHDFQLTKDQAAGIVGNLGHESGGFNQMQEINPMGGGQGGYGWAQWTGPRRREFFDWAKQNKLNPNSDEANYGFLKHELEGQYKGAIDAVKRTNNSTDATVAFERNYEKAGIKAYGSRENYASSAVKSFNKQQLAQSVIPNTSTTGKSLQEAEVQKQKIQSQVNTKSNQPPIVVNSPTTTTAMNGHNMGPIPSVRDDSPVILQALKQDLYS